MYNTWEREDQWQLSFGFSKYIRRQKCKIRRNYELLLRLTYIQCQVRITEREIFVILSKITDVPEYRYFQTLGTVRFKSFRRKNFRHFHWRFWPRSENFRHFQKTFCHFQLLCYTRLNVFQKSSWRKFLNLTVRTKWKQPSIKLFMVHYRLQSKCYIVDFFRGPFSKKSTILGQLPKKNKPIKISR